MKSSAPRTRQESECQVTQVRKRRKPPFGADLEKVKGRARLRRSCLARSWRESQGQTRDPVCPEKGVDFPPEEEGLVKFQEDRESPTYERV